jgi:hypothetical protein
MTDGSVRVVPLGEDRGDEAAVLIARAFQDDPLFAYGCPDPVARARWLPWVMRWSVWQGFLFGQTLGTAGRLDGVAATIGPAGGAFTEEQLAGFGYGRGREVVGTELWDQSTAALNAAFGPADAALHRAVSEPHWQTSPTHPRRGWGRSVAGTSRNRCRRALVGAPGVSANRASHFATLRSVAADPDRRWRSPRG